MEKKPPGLPLSLENRFNVSRETKFALELYVSLLLKWQLRINLIGPDTQNDVWWRHIADSLALAPLIEDRFRSGMICIADLGAGAGLPGIPLGLYLRALRSVHVHLIDSNIKKVAFLREAVRQTGLAATVHHCRIEQLEAGELIPQPDILVARALAPLDRLSELALAWLEQGALGIFHKGRHVDKELEKTVRRASLRYKVLSLGAKGDSSVVLVKAASGVSKTNEKDNH